MAGSAIGPNAPLSSNAATVGLATGVTAAGTAAIRQGEIFGLHKPEDAKYVFAASRIWRNGAAAGIVAAEALAATKYLHRPESITDGMVQGAVAGAVGVGSIQVLRGLLDDGWLQNAAKQNKVHPARELAFRTLTRGSAAGAVGVGLGFAASFVVGKEKS